MTHVLSVNALRYGIIILLATVDRLDFCRLNASVPSLRVHREIRRHLFQTGLVPVHWRRAAF